MSVKCLNTPLSWLTLERYQSGELPLAEAALAEAHLLECPVCAECYKSLEVEVALPPLPAPKARVAEQRSTSRWPLPWAWLGLGLAAAAAVLFVLLPGRSVNPPNLAGYPPAKVSYKGGELSLSVVRERQGQIAHMPKSVQPGDRLKVELTCPAANALRWDVAVIDDSGVSYPLQANAKLQCGNRVALPGAFRLDGKGAAWICAMVAKELPPRETLTRLLNEHHPVDTVCHRLKVQADSPSP
jgi:hypothetical protein